MTDYTGPGGYYEDETTMESKMSTDKTTQASHWLHANEPGTFDELKSETQRLQRTLRVLIAVGKITESEAARAYEFAL